MDEVADPAGGDGADAPSFRVYTPAELRSAPLRPSHLPKVIAGAPAGDSTPAGNVGSRVLMAWMAIGVVAGALVLTAFALLFNLTDDTRGSAKAPRAEATVQASAEQAPSSALNAPVAVANPVAVAATDFEIADDPAPPPRSAKARKPAGKPKPLVRGAPY